MMYLLTNTFIFAALPNNCYCQIAGPSISELIAPKRRLKPQILSSLSSKKHKPSPPTEAQGTGSNSARKTAMDSVDVPAKLLYGISPINDTTPISSIIFQRSRTFYVKAVHGEHKTLNQFLLYPCKLWQHVDVTPIAKIRLTDAYFDHFRHQCFISKWSHRDRETHVRDLPSATWAQEYFPGPLYSIQESRQVVTEWPNDSQIEIPTMAITQHE